MKTRPYGKRLFHASICEYKKFWSGYRRLVALSGLAAPLLLQIQRGRHSVLSLLEVLESGGIGLFLSLGSTYLYSRRKGAEFLDTEWQNQIARDEEFLTQQKEQIAVGAAKIKALSIEVEELKKPKRTAFEEKEFQRIRGFLGDCDEDCIAVLRHLMRHGKMGKYQGGAIENLPGLGCKRAESALKKLLENQVVTWETMPQGNMRWQQWTIAPGVKSALEELL